MAPAENDRATARRDFFRHLRYYVGANIAIYLFYLFAESHGLWPLYLAGFWFLFLAGHFWRAFVLGRGRREAETDLRPPGLEENEGKQ